VAAAQPPAAASLIATPDQEIQVIVTDYTCRRQR
jgi:hypothetical protein